MEKFDVMKEYYNALQQNRIRAYFQPMYTTNGFRVASAEVLCRMEMYDGTMILPEKFIKKLESTGEICSLDWYMVKEACSILSDMRFMIGEITPLSVNLSRRHVEEWNPADHLSSIVDSYALDHKLIEIEITETYNEKDFLLKDMIDQIRAKGFSVAVDDFGSGYSTLGFISEMCFDTLKIDRSLLQGDFEDHRSKVVIESIIKMADSLGAKTVAEGVENTKQLSYLNCSGCTLLQGDFLSEPLPEHRFMDLLKAQNGLKMTG